MNALHPTITASLSPFMGSMGMFTGSPTADAEAHFDALADTFTTDVTYLGVEFSVEVSRHNGHVECVTEVATGDNWIDELSDGALHRISKLATRKEFA